jgi:hypothetical protein
MKWKFRLVISLLIIVFATGLFVYLRYFFTYEQRNVIKRKIETVTGQNLTITVFGLDGKIIKRWVGVEKITSGRAKDQSGERNYTFFYTKDGKYVQIPDSVWYLAEEE